MEMESLQRKRIVADSDVGDERLNEWLPQEFDISDEPPLTMNSGEYYLPMEKGLTPEGEDSCFVCDERQTIGVADGSGGRVLAGIYAGEFARSLMRNSFDQLQTEPEGGANPSNILKEALKKTRDVPGSSTACIVTLRDSNLYAVNVGDSGFMLFRGNKCVYKSPVQDYYFNCPYQCTGKRKNRAWNFTKIYDVPVQHGDILVTGTDGLFDNMFPSEIEKILEKNYEWTYWPNYLAKLIAESAQRNSHSPDYYSPFAKASEQAGRKHNGGKIDDITVIVSEIQAS